MEEDKKIVFDYCVEQLETFNEKQLIALRDIINVKVGKNVINHKDNIDRIIYMWRRYSGVYDGKDKKYSFSNLNDLNDRIDNYWHNVQEFDWSMGVVPEDD